MKEGLRQRLEREMAAIADRIKMLDDNIKSYVKVGNLADAAINQIKQDTFHLVLTKLQDVLNED